MTDENWLREALTDAVPTPPGAPDRATAARTRAHRARRRLRIGVAVAVTATVVAAGGLVTALRDPADTPSPADKASDPSSPYDVADCPPTTGTDAVQDPDAPVAVPDSAVSVRLCRQGLPFDVPKDALVTNVDDLAATINALETIPEPQICAADGGPVYRLVFGYDDGSTFVVTGSLRGCRDLVVGSTRRLLPIAALNRFGELLRDQRAGLSPPAAPDPSTIDCTWGRGTLALGQLPDLTAAVVCIASADGRGWRRAPISPDELTQLQSDMARNTDPNAGVLDCGAPPPFPRVVGLTVWGDRVDVQAECGLGWFPVAERDLGRSVWNPGDDARALLERLVSEAR